ncbi:PREDICTED: general odorant-binding protein 56d-like [Dufourea novaeangliae]|uniref:general odorant-binding protein 56d-like n=1 Tax=Dufourea novaeangliae TaxID=178035 RepID=UPI0007677AAE|nr:PREDICTED: general odorant-binding protein 56d-like [Dufourea novaeangliae]
MFCNRLVFVALAGALIFLEPVNTDIRRDCRRETKVSWAALKKMKSGDFEQNDQKLKCYVKCFMVKNGILNNNAEIDVQRALRHIPRSLQDSSRHLFNKCKSVSATDACDKAFQMCKCYVKHQPQILHSVPFL